MRGVSTCFTDFFFALAPARPSPFTRCAISWQRVRRRRCRAVRPSRRFQRMRPPCWRRCKPTSRLSAVRCGRVERRCWAGVGRTAQTEHNGQQVAGRRWPTVAACRRARASTAGLVLLSPPPPMAQPSPRTRRRLRVRALRLRRRQRLRRPRRRHRRAPPCRSGECPQGDEAAASRGARPGLSEGRPTRPRHDFLCVCVCVCVCVCCVSVI